MHSFSKKEIFLSIALIIFAIVLFNPSDIFMPSMFQMGALALLVVFVGLFAGLVVHESISDEREQFHRDQAGRVGYSTGLLVVLVGIVVQSIKHIPVDGWLLGALVSMVIFKVIARAYSRFYH
jgi:hypothetical protein